ncbi:chromate efflux transporter [Mariniradius sediminis]|uniref:Chromate efflux transporter n=1 Tax=Mariniradius sediminis TaxID=2909237 RepID=A0ABS9BQE2_9BACT|nr:chromate efflux transporter [Mariniradius sediminis]
MSVRKVRYYLYLKDVLLLSLTSFGGPQAFLAMVLETMVRKRGYIREQELWELNALCQILPGPTSTQTISAIGYRIGGANLAYLSLFVWILPATLIMIGAAFLIDFLQMNTPGALTFSKFIQPMAIGFIIFAAQKTIFKMVKTTEASVLMMFSVFISFFYNSPFIFPLLLVVGGVTTSLKYRNLPKESADKKLVIKWANFYLWAGILLVAAVLGAVSQFRGVILFENFYRNGSLIFGGGQVLIPYLYTEFVEFKKFLSSQEFLTGYALSQGIPGPTFSIASYIGALSMREDGFVGMLTGGLVAAAGIFLPGTFLIFFVIRFWDQVKKHRPVKAALEGINAVSCGMLVAAAFLLFEPLDANLFNIAAILGTYVLLRYGKLSSPLIIGIGIFAGVIYQWVVMGVFQ